MRKVLGVSHELLVLKSEQYLQLQNWLIKAVSRIIFTREAMNEQAIKCALCFWNYVALIFALPIRKKHREHRALVYPTTCLTINQRGCFV